MTSQEQTAQRAAGLYFTGTAEFAIQLRRIIDDASARQAAGPSRRAVGARRGRRRLQGLDEAVAELARIWRGWRVDEPTQF